MINAIRISYAWNCTFVYGCSPRILEIPISEVECLIDCFFIFQSLCTSEIISPLKGMELMSIINYLYKFKLNKEMEKRLNASDQASTHNQHLSH